MGRRAFFKAGIFSLFAAGLPLSVAARGEGENQDDLTALTSRVVTLETTLNGRIETLQDNLNKQLTASPPNVPVGTIVSYAGLIDQTSDHPMPAGFLLCDGQPVSVSEYGQLWLKVRVADGPGFRGCWGGDGNPNFNLPDLMGRFLRGVDKDTNGQPTNPPRDPDRGNDKRLASRPGGNVGNNVGSIQEDALQSHKHPDKGHGHSTDATRPTGEVQSDDSDQRAAPPNPPAASVGTGFANLGDPADSGTGAGVVRHGQETRPKNAYVYWIIRAK